MSDVSKTPMDAPLDFELDGEQWAEIEQEAKFAWSHSDGSPLYEPAEREGFKSLVLEDQPAQDQFDAIDLSVSELERQSAHADFDAVDLSTSELDRQPVQGQLDEAGLVTSAKAEGHSGFQSDEIELPPQRVRFATLVNLKVVGEEDYHEGVIVNLSTEGVACVCARSLEKGTKVWITFRLGLIDDPLSLMCEIVWQRLPKSGEPSYGLRFLELGAPERKRIEDVVAERSEGRAAEWPLPILPNVGSRQQARVSPWLSGTVGLALGLAIAFVTSAVPVSQLTAGVLPGSLFQRTSVQTPEHKVADEVIVTEMPVSQLIAETRTRNKESVSTGEKTVWAKGMKAQRDERFEGVVLPKKNSAASERVTDVKQLGQTLKETSLKPVGAESSRAFMTRVVGDRIIPLKQSKTLELDLRTEKPVSTFNTFWLSAPRRMVVDVPGNKSLFELLSYQVEHSLAQRVRVGAYNDKVRFVIETVEGATGEVVVKNGQLIIELTDR